MNKQAYILKFKHCKIYLQILTKLLFRGIESYFKVSSYVSPSNMEVVMICASVSLTNVCFEFFNETPPQLRLNILTGISAAMTTNGTISRNNDL